jgi:hypothetical protein
VADELLFDPDFMLECRIRAVQMNSPDANTIPLSITEAERILTALRTPRPVAEISDEVVERVGIALLGARMVIEGKATNATGALAKADWRPDRAHIEGMRNTMNEALEYLDDARAALQEIQPLLDKGCG